ncbi:MAG: SPFH domain-containing protein, partial [Lachnospiraceae bacterium]|nr:SPFH domain-containing protein [Lachnospiraceae bacterium]
MGLIKAAKDSISTLLADQWRECFSCDSLSNDVLVTKARKMVTEGRNSNTKSSDNVISNGSIVIVNEGQCMLIVDQGGVVDFCAEAGEFIYDTSTEPSLFYGNLGENIKSTFTTLWNRFTFGGNAAKDQRVYYFNTKEIMGNPYGTPSPIPFRLVSLTSNYQHNTTIKCNGEYSFKIVDPLLFYKNVCGNVRDDYTKSGEEGRQLISMMKRELLTKLPTALANVSAKGVLPDQLNLHTEEICEALKQELSQKWTAERGIEVSSMTITAVVPEEALEALNVWENRAAMRDPGMTMAQAANAEAFAGMIGRSSLGTGQNGSTDPMSGMMNMMAMNMMGGMMGGNGMMSGNNMMNNGYAGQQPMNAMPQNNMGAAQPQMQAPVLGWNCSCGKTDNRGKFCGECGSPKPAAAGWTCSCGHVNQGKFC